MRQLLLAALLLAALVLASGQAVAEWVRIGESDIYVVYADPFTVHKSGDVVRMSSMLDYKELQPGGARSAETVHEYDCQGQRVRMLSMTVFSGQMGSGDVLLRIAKPVNWVPPTRAGEDCWKFACGQK